MCVMGLTDGKVSDAIDKWQRELPNTQRPVEDNMRASSDAQRTLLHTVRVLQENGEYNCIAKE